MPKPKETNMGWFKTWFTLNKKQNIPGVDKIPKNSTSSSDPSGEGVDDISTRGDGGPLPDRLLYGSDRGWYDGGGPRF